MDRKELLTMDYKRIENEVKALTPTDIKGKPYVEVNQRIKVFRKCFPEGSIVTKIVRLQDGICVIKATVYDNGRVIAVGHAYEKEGSTFINKTSYIENAETSAVGRALGILGIGVDGAVASAIEVANAISNQDMDKLNSPISKAEAKVLIQYAKSTGYTGTNEEVAQKLCDHFGVSKLSEVTGTQRAAFIKGV